MNCVCVVLEDTTLNYTYTVLNYHSFLDLQYFFFAFEKIKIHKNKNKNDWYFSVMAHIYQRGEPKYLTVRGKTVNVIHQTGDLIWKTNYINTDHFLWVIKLGFKLRTHTSFFFIFFIKSINNRTSIRNLYQPLHQLPLTAYFHNLTASHSLPVWLLVSAGPCLRSQEAAKTNFIQESHSWGSAAGLCRLSCSPLFWEGFFSPLGLRCQVIIVQYNLMTLWLFVFSTV